MVKEKKKHEKAVVLRAFDLHFQIINKCEWLKIYKYKREHSGSPPSSCFPISLHGNRFPVS